MNNIKRELKNGIFFTAIGKYVSYISNFIVQIFLSRILTPSDWGVAAAVLVIVPFFLLLSESGAGPAIIQNDFLSDFDLSSIFKILAAISFFASIIFGLCGWPISRFYNNKAFISLMWAFAPTLLFSILQVVPMAILNKKEEFKQVNLTNAIAFIVGGIIGVIAGFAGARYFALAFTNAIPALVNFLLMYRLSGFHMKKGFSLNSFKKILSFSVYQLSFQIVNYFPRNLDNLLAEKFLGKAPTGQYNKSYQLLTYPSQLFTAIVTPVLQPVLARRFGDVKIVKKAYLTVMRILFILGIPLSAYLSLNAKQIILVIFGNQWGPAVLPFQMLALTIWVQLVIATTGPIFQARNLTKLLFNLGLITAIITVGFIILGVSLGSIVYLAVGVTIGYLINFFITYFYLMRKALKGTLFELLKEMRKPIVSTVLPTILDLIFLQYFSYSSSIFWKNFFILVLSSLIFLICWLISAYLDKDFKFLINLFKRS